MVISSYYARAQYPTLRIQICPKEGIIPKILFWGWDWNPESYSREGSGFLGRRHPKCFSHLKRFVENSWAEGWHKGMSSGQIIRTKNPPKGSVLEGEWDPGYFSKILVKVQYHFIWPNVVGSRSGGFCYGRHQLGGIFLVQNLWCSKVLRLMPK